jgi:hypothetical protein
MKAKIFSKKLVLNKKTVSNLNNVDMKVVKGGIDDPNTIGGRDTNPCHCPTYTCCIPNSC